MLCICGCLSSTSKYEAEIEKEITIFFDKISAINFTLNDSGIEIANSDYFSDNDYFSGVEIHDEMVIELFDVGVNDIYYEIREIRVNNSDLSAECILVIDFADIQAIAQNAIPIGYYDKDTLIESIVEKMLDSHAAIIEEEISIHLKYDNNHKKWNVTDYSDLVDVFSKPYASLSLPILQTPEEAFQLFVQALRDGDLDSVSDVFGLDTDNISEGKRNFYIWEIKRFTLIRKDEVSVDGDNATVLISFQHPRAYFEHRLKMHYSSEEKKWIIDFRNHSLVEYIFNDYED